MTILEYKLNNMKEYWLSLNTFKRVKLILSLISILLLLIFAFQNMDKIEVDFIFFSYKVPITIIILVAFITGFIVSSLYSFKKNKTKDDEIASLKLKIKAFLNDKKDSL